MTRTGRFSERPTSAPPTAAPASSSLLPTPDAGVFNDGQSVEAYRARKAREKAKGYNGNGGGTLLAMAVRLLPTPIASDAKGGRSGPDAARERQLRSAVRLLPTPEAKNSHAGPDYARASRPDSGGDDLTTAVWKISRPAPGGRTAPPSSAGPSSSDDPPTLPLF
jgi:hypothetical protein